MPRGVRKTSTPATDAAPVTPVKPGMRIDPVALAMSSVPLQKPATPWTIPTPAPGVAPPDAKMAMDDAFGGLYGYASAGYAINGAISEGLAFLGYPTLAGMAQRPEYRRMVGTLAQEMTRRWGHVTSTGEDDQSDKVAKLEAAMKRFKVRDIFREAAEQDGYFGIGHIYIDLGSTDPEELKTPLLLKPAKIRKGGLKGLRTIEPIWCYPGYYGSSEPLDPDFYQPQTWYVMSRQIHRTRLMSLVSREVPDLLKPAYMFGGLSLTQIANETVNNWLRTRQSVSDLLHSFTVWNLKTNMQATLQGGGGDDLLARAQLFNQLRDNGGLMVTDFESEELVNISASLGSLDKLQAQAQEQQAAIDGMPLIKLVGYTPSGLNATGEGEMDAWRDRVRAQQEHLFNDPLKHVMDVIQLSEFGEIDDSLGWEWESLEDPNEMERASVRKTDVDADVELIAAGVISPEEVRQRLANDDGGVYNGLDVNDLPDLPDDGDNEPEAKILPDPAKSVRAADSLVFDAGSP